MLAKFLNKRCFCVITISKAATTAATSAAGGRGAVGGTSTAATSYSDPSHTEAGTATATGGAGAGAVGAGAGRCSRFGVFGEHMAFFGSSITVDVTVGSECAEVALVSDAKREHDIPCSSDVIEIHVVGAIRAITDHSLDDIAGGDGAV